jgi:hypothetical protein
MKNTLISVKFVVSMLGRIIVVEFPIVMILVPSCEIYVVVVCTELLAISDVVLVIVVILRRPAVYDIVVKWR